MKKILLVLSLSVLSTVNFSKEVQGRQGPLATQEGRIGQGERLRQLEFENAELRDSLYNNNIRIQNLEQTNNELRNVIEVKTVHTKNLKEEIQILNRRLDRVLGRRGLINSENTQPPMQRSRGNNVLAREQMRISLVGKALSESNAVLLRSTQHDYDLCELKLTGTEDNETNTFYDLKMCKYDRFSRRVFTDCFRLAIDTDFPNREAWLVSKECY